MVAMGVVPRDAVEDALELGELALDGAIQPVSIVVARANHHVTYPARFQLVAAMKPCR